MAEKLGRQGDEYILSADQVEAYRCDGYLTLRDVVTEEELQAIEPDFERFIQGEVTGMGRDFCDMSGPADRRFKDFSLVNAMLPRKYQPHLQDNVYERRAASIARQLLGEQAALDYDQFLAKRPNKPDAMFSWHQDLGYWPTNTPDTFTATCSLALDDADSQNGCLQVVPGSQKGALRPHRPLHGEGKEEFHILSVTLDPADRIVELPLKRGDITVHDELILHGSGGNRTADRWRRTYIVAFRHQDTVAYERSVGFTHSHNDEIKWQTHLGALNL
ncbi:phytanoyl-CoA dioxygenase family protein [Novosphingobium aquae]|uniref:Phytanoyl-CoA dioxygenase family protein n=1 Tax=Novosphingobium aquae TaxID=3133435 RepID=A0ABU8S6Y0_9SPHN